MLFAIIQSQISLLSRLGSLASQVRIFLTHSGIHLTRKSQESIEKTILHSYIFISALQLYPGCELLLVGDRRCPGHGRALNRATDSKKLWNNIPYGSINVPPNDLDHDSTVVEVCAERRRWLWERSVRPGARGGKLLPYMAGEGGRGSSQGWRKIIDPISNFRIPRPPCCALHINM